MDAPKNAASEQEIHPDQQAENSGGNEHSRYCTAFILQGLKSGCLPDRHG
jgi:hypothetical protein